MIDKLFGRPDRLKSFHQKRAQEREDNASVYEYLRSIDIHSPRKFAISQMSASEIKECHWARRTGKTASVLPAPSCYEILSVFCARALQLCEKDGCNAVATPNYVEALAKAQAFDQDLSVPDPIPPLWGVPLSVKDAFDQEGQITTCGLASRAVLDPCTQDGLALDLLKRAGAIPFVRSNMPQAGMLPETDNFVFGRAHIPNFPDRTVGGSSGGEGGLLAAGASILGIGSDVGGSLRIPSVFCGCATFKPTPTRVTQKGMEPARLAQQTIIPVVLGPMAKTVSDLRLFMQVFWEPGHTEDDPYTPLIQPTPILRKPLKIGYFESDGWAEPCLTVKRGVHDGVKLLRGLGHTVVDVQEEFKDLIGWPVVDLYSQVITAEGNLNEIKEALDGEKMLPHYKSFRMLADTPNLLRPVGTFLLKSFGQERAGMLLGTQRNGGLSTIEYHKLNGRVLSYRDKFTKLMQKLDLDCLLFPGLGFPAFKHGQSKTLITTMSYVFLANLLQFPAGVLPITHVLPGEETYAPESYSNDMLTKEIKILMKDSLGLPVGVQLMSIVNQDETVLHAMEQLESALRASKV